MTGMPAPDGPLLDWIEEFGTSPWLVVLELNGVTGEPVHIYQPGFPWRQGIRDLCRHWKQACEIGALNRARGPRPTPLRRPMAVIRLHRRHQWFEADDLMRPPTHA